MLTYLLAKLTVAQAHAIARWAGIYDGLHDWLHGFCPCQVSALALEDDDDD